MHCYSPFGPWDNSPKKTDGPVLEIFQAHPDREFTPEELVIATGRQKRLEEIRKALHLLKKKGHVIKLAKTKLATTGKMNHVWILAN